MANTGISEIRPVVTCEEAKAAGLKRYFTGDSCGKGHVVERLVCSGACVECLRINGVNWRAANPERAKEVNNRHVNANRDKIVARKRANRGLDCRHCGTPIPFSEPKPGAQRASRPKFCSDRCRLYSKVDMSPGQGPKGECWEYQGGKHKFGYGMINRSGSKASEVTTSHAYGWEVENGPVPDGMFVLHKCDNPPCCRPDHLFLGTHQDNVDDMCGKERHQHGEKHCRAKLTETEVLEIRASTGSERQLAKKYGVTDSAIHLIRSMRTWKHLP